MTSLSKCEHYDARITVDANKRVEPRTRALLVVCNECGAILGDTREADCNELLRDLLHMYQEAENIRRTLRELPGRLKGLEQDTKDVENMFFNELERG